MGYLQTMGIFKTIKFHMGNVVFLTYDKPGPTGSCSTAFQNWQLQFFSVDQVMHYNSNTHVIITQKIKIEKSDCGLR